MRIVIILFMQDDATATKRKNSVNAAAGERLPPRRTTSKALLGDARVLVIEHEGRQYLLRLTQQGKLILTA
jgi:hemin uptake protein HemP